VRMPKWTRMAFIWFSQKAFEIVDQLRVRRCHGNDLDERHVARRVEEMHATETKSQVFFGSAFPMNLREMLIAGRLDIAEAIFDDRRRRRQLLEILDRPLATPLGSPCFAVRSKRTTGTFALTRCAAICATITAAAPAKAGNARKPKGLLWARKPKLTHHQRQEALARRDAGEALVDIARTSHSTVSRLAP
jgi:hypothetical protein